LPAQAGEKEYVMKKITVLLAALSTLVCTSAFARDNFYYRFSCYDNGNWIDSSEEQHELLSAEAIIVDDWNIACDEVCVTLSGNDADDIYSTDLERYKGDLSYADGNITKLSDFGAHDNEKNVYSSTATYCWADWTDNYWAELWLAKEEEFRKTVMHFYDADGSYHTISLVPAAYHYIPIV
jgi:hypothetical protein